MIALKTQYPGERYEVVAVDLATGAARVMLDLTVLLRALEKEGWSNNVEGIAVTRDGALWLGERLSVLELLGGLLVLCGVAAVNAPGVWRADRENTRTHEVAVAEREVES